jgi:hypothetical protein
MLPSLRKFNQSEIAKQRLKIIDFYYSYGEKATIDAFGADRKVINRWQKRYQLSGYRLKSLVPKSTKPVNLRQSEVDSKVVDFISQYREDHHNTGKEKLKPDVDVFCKQNSLPLISVSTIGRIIKRKHIYFPSNSGRIYHNPNSKWATNSVNKKKRLRVKHAPKPKDYGYILSDTVEKIIYGVKRYFISAIEIKSKITLTLEYSRLNSANMTDFYFRFRQFYPLTVKFWQNDNGGENLKHFDKQLETDGIPHLFIYPHCPRIDTFIERYNRTLQEEFLNDHLEELIDIKQGNKLLVNWNLYYNTRRRHHSLNLLSPVNYLISQGQMSQMCWTNTFSVLFVFFLL